MFQIIRFRPIINKKSIRVFSNISPNQPNNNKFDFGDVICACIATLFIYTKNKEFNYTDYDQKEK